MGAAPGPAVCIVKHALPLQFGHHIQRVVPHVIEGIDQPSGVVGDQGLHPADSPSAHRGEQLKEVHLAVQEKLGIDQDRCIPRPAVEVAG